MKKLQSGILVAAAIIAFSSCKKNPDETSESPDMNTAVAVATGDQVASQQFSDVFNISLGVQSSDAGEDVGMGTSAGILYKPGGGEGTLGDQCFTVTVAPKVRGEWPKTVTWDFGNGCLGKDGKMRKGKIISIFTAPAYMPGAKISTTLEGYVVDSFAVSGTMTVENTTANNQFGWKVDVINGKITNTNTGFWRKWDATRTHTMVEGNSTPFNPMDDVYKITGGAKASNSNGISWKGDITSPVEWKFDCKWASKGQITFYWDQNPVPATLDFGNGSCDNKATISYKDYSKEITLK